MNRPARLTLACAGAAALAMSALGASAVGAEAAPHHGDTSTSTPIKHVVVIFGENVSFDHYFATYPNAANVPGETQQGTGVRAPTFTAAPNTPGRSPPFSTTTCSLPTTRTRRNPPASPLHRP